MATLATCRVDTNRTAEGFRVTVRTDSRSFTVPVVNADGFVSSRTAAREAIAHLIDMTGACIDLDPVPGSEYPHGLSLSFVATLSAR